MPADGMQPGPQPSTIIYQGKKGYKMVRQYLMGDMLGEGAQGKVKEAVRVRVRARVWIRAQARVRANPNPNHGKVKEAVDSQTLRRVAIKIVNLRQLRKVRSAEENLKHELAIHRRLKQANVVELIEEFRVAEKEKLYVVLELVNGEALTLTLTLTPTLLTRTLTLTLNLTLTLTLTLALTLTLNLTLTRRLAPAAGRLAARAYLARGPRGALHSDALHRAGVLPLQGHRAPRHQAVQPHAERGRHTLIRLTLTLTLIRLTLALKLTLTLTLTLTR